MTFMKLSTLKVDPKRTLPKTEIASKRSVLPLTDKPPAPIAMNPRLESVLPARTSLKTDKPLPIFSDSAMDKPLPNLTKLRTLMEEPKEVDPTKERPPDTCKSCLIDKELDRDPDTAIESAPSETKFPATDRDEPNQPTPRTVRAFPIVAAP